MEAAAAQPNVSRMSNHCPHDMRSSTDRDAPQCGRWGRRVSTRLVSAGVILAVLGLSTGCYLGVSTTALAPQSTARLEAPEAFPVHQRTDAGFLLACHARSVEGTVAAVRGDTVEFHSVWIRRPVGASPRCAAGRTSRVVVSDLRGASEPVQRRSQWRTLGVAALAIPLVLIAIIGASCEFTVCT